MKKRYFILLVGIISIKGFSQTPAPTPTVAPAEKEWDVNLYGFIRTDYIFDSRKSATVREDNLNLYPLDEMLDSNGTDLNAVNQSNFLSITSRLFLQAQVSSIRLTWSTSLELFSTKTVCYTPTQLSALTPTLL